MAEQPHIKPDPEGGSPLVEDDFDDAGDLEFYDQSVPGDPMGTMYLARLPNYVWQAWADLDDDAEIQLGTIRQWDEVDGNGASHLLLKSDIAQHQHIPKEYNMDISDPNVYNTFVFTEQDLPGYAAKNKAKADALARGIPAHLLRDKNPKPPPPGGPQPFERGKRGPPQYRRGIPKKTTIGGRIKHEISCTPVPNAETDHILQLRAIEAMKPKAQTTILGALPYGPDGIIYAGTQRAHDAFEGFIKTAPKPDKAKKMENKTARWEEQRLLDALEVAFSEYTYWSMKALRAKIPQPEAFLRETLDRFAVLHRSGRFANQWSVKPEFLHLIEKRGKGLPAADTAAPGGEAEAGPSDVDAGEDEDLKMEDVL
ncbi:putative transcription initiation factor [Phialemonium atrogriseum]|uniref:Transcription initiation factor IIF subunit beta n=1 Tax=Phialemonium atrogriseum TaxID=1093897 RepID=A0AAJ0FIS2_9PEZI|nr:putative transcription initiation factor [Phialemonium atrogriseum]KAK1764683.1 putative transcription initiation factor [Phialemonium atrogriseum]